MWIIKKVRIKNFRSIIDGNFYPGNVSILVGENDVGKSNYIRALNLFFNGQTDPGRSFDFGSDFSNRAIVGKGKAKQVEIILEIQPPPSFTDQRLITWRRYWRDGSNTFDSEQIIRMPGNEVIDLKTKAVQWLRGIRFRYVPAIKGTDYFAALMRELHDTLAITIDNELRSASSDFIEVVRKHTQGISSHLSEHIKLDSRLQLPENLRSLFEVLDFQTNSGGHNLSLRLRGDGIKVRHIPAVLKFLSDQERELAPAGRPKPTSIWGYEEPENNLELKRAFEHADEIYSARESAQIFLTTHSPAFYGLASDRKEFDVRAFIAKPNVDYGTQLILISNSEASFFDEEMGIMPIIAPYISHKVAELKEAKESIENLKETINSSMRPMIVVAGETDAIYLKAAMQLFDVDLHNKIDIISIGSQSRSGSVGAGDSQLLNLLNQWKRQPNLLNRRAFIALDCDVKNFPDDMPPSIEIYKLPIQDNKTTDVGIENMLPSSVFTEEYYETKEHKKQYGEKTITRTFLKMRLCESICTPSGKLYSDRSFILKNFEPVIALARKHLTESN